MKLKILIPTYKRPASLRGLLEELEKQIHTLEVFSDVIIHVFNNTQNEDINKLYEEVFASFSTRVLLKATTNGGNLGMVGNWNECLKCNYVQSDFIWVLNDDDLPQSNALDLIFQGMRDFPNKSLVFWSREVSIENVEFTPQWTKLRKQYFAWCINPRLKSSDFLMDYPFQSISSFVFCSEHIYSKTFNADFYPSFDYHFASLLLPSIDHIVISEFLMKIKMGQNESLKPGVRENMIKVRKSVRAVMFENQEVGMLMRMIIWAADKTDSSNSYLISFLRNMIKLVLLVTTRRD